MRGQQNNSRKYRSLLEFQKEFYPLRFTVRQQLMKIDDPDEFGTRLAQMSLMKLKQSLSQNKPHH